MNIFELSQVHAVSDIMREPGSFSVLMTMICPDAVPQSTLHCTFYPTPRLQPPKDQLEKVTLPAPPAMVIHQEELQRKPAASRGHTATISLAHLATGQKLINNSCRFLYCTELQILQTHLAQQNFDKDGITNKLVKIQHVHTSWHCDTLTHIINTPYIHSTSFYIYKRHQTAFLKGNLCPWVS